MYFFILTTVGFLVIIFKSCTYFSIFIYYVNNNSSGSNKKVYDSFQLGMVWIPLIPIFNKLSQEIVNFKTSLGYIVNLSEKYQTGGCC